MGGSLSATEEAAEKDELLTEVDIIDEISDDEEDGVKKSKLQKDDAVAKSQGPDAEGATGLEHGGADEASPRGENKDVQIEASQFIVPEQRSSFPKKKLSKESIQDEDAVLRGPDGPSAKGRLSAKARPVKDKDEDDIMDSFNPDRQISIASTGRFSSGSWEEEDLERARLDLINGGTLNEELRNQLLAAGIQSLIPGPDGKLRAHRKTNDGSESGTATPRGANSRRGSKGVRRERRASLGGESTISGISVSRRGSFSLAQSDGRRLSVNSEEDLDALSKARDAFDKAAENKRKSRSLLHPRARSRRSQGASGGSVGVGKKTSRSSSISKMFQP